MPKFDSSVAAASAAKRVVRVDPTSAGFVYAAAAALVVVFAASFLISAQALGWVGVQAGLEPWLAPWAFPAALDGGLLAVSMSMLARRAMGASTRMAVVLLTVFTLASVGANLWRELTVSSLTGLSLVGHIGAAALPPVLLLAGSESALTLLVRAVPGDAAQRAAVQRLADSGRLAAVSGGQPSPAEKEDTAAAIRAAYAASGRTASYAALSRQLGVSTTAVKKALGEQKQSPAKSKPVTTGTTAPALVVPDL